MNTKQKYQDLINVNIDKNIYNTCIIVFNEFEDKKEDKENCTFDNVIFTGS